MHAVLALLGFWDVLQEKCWCRSGPDQAQVGRSVEAAAVVQRGERSEPEVRLRFGVDTVQGHNHLHGGTVGDLVCLGDPFSGSIWGVLPLFRIKHPLRALVRGSWLALFKELRFEVGDAFVGEAEVGPGAFESFVQGSVFLGQLLDSPLEGGVLGGELLDGFAGGPSDRSP